MSNFDFRTMPIKSRWPLNPPLYFLAATQFLQQEYFAIGRNRLGKAVDNNAPINGNRDTGVNARFQSGVGFNKGTQDFADRFGFYFNGFIASGLRPQTGP